MENSVSEYQGGGYQGIRVSGILDFDPRWNWGLSDKEATKDVAVDEGGKNIEYRISNIEQGMSNNEVMGSCMRGGGERER